ncbi:MAG: T9SS type A sorting domain-containing protein [Dyadobacter sp.]|uniref:Ig-like domain-containing protein n=1 Tax=Dyadobacter sp. TaxID=1914288 RepID=UPI003262FCCB
MKRILLLFSILIALVSGSSYGQTCSGSLSSTTVSPCLEQPFTLSTPNATAFGGSINWEVSTDAEGPWTAIGTSNFGEPTGSAKFTVTPAEAGVRYYRGVRPGNCTYAPVMVTVGAGAAPSPPVISASTYCNGIATLTASGAGEGTYTWYRINSVSQVTQVQSGASNEYVIPNLPNGSFFESGFRYYVTFSNGTCTSSASGILLVLPSGAVPPAPTIAAQSTSICVNQSTTLTAIGSGTIKWYRTNPTTLLGEGSNILISPTGTRDYFATSTINGTCTSTNSNFVNVALALPTATTTMPASQDFIVSEPIRIVLADSDCKIFAQFSSSEASGAEIFSKTVNAKVSFDNTVKIYNGMPYVQRHFDFHPTQALTPGYSPFYTITMYFTQADFDAFNVTSTVKLPLNQADVEGYASNLRILHAYGTPNSLPAAPGNYSSGNVVEDCIACTTVGWSTEYNAWAVSINTIGFSGFFITAKGATSLPVTLVNFNAIKAERSVVLSWQTSEETNSDRFEIQHSANGKQWTMIGQVNATGESKTLQRYTYTHATPRTGENLYRMKMVDVDATFAMSRIVSVKMDDANELNVFPNPATRAVSVTSEVTITGYQLVGQDGTIVTQDDHKRTKELVIRNLNVPGGLYFLKLNLENGTIENRKLIIE